jgi:4-hydroxybenzoate polyprenyltransferase
MLEKNRFQDFFRLMRLHQTTGIWLVLWPAIWGILFSSPQLLPMKLIVLFSVGAVFARGAGCIINDIVDKDIDKFVERTKMRPIASGKISVKDACIFLAILLIICLLILLQLSPLAIIIGFCSLVPITIYPFMKRITFWPQLFLGFTFNLSSLVGVAAASNKIDLGAIFLYVSCIFWTLGYDTIYGHQDKKDDVRIGVKSSSIILGSQTKYWLYFFYLSLISFLILSGYYFNLKPLLFILFLIPTLLHLLWQIVTLNIDNTSDCYKKFYSNRYIGWLVSLSIILTKLIAEKS